MMVTVWRIVIETSLHEITKADAAIFLLSYLVRGREKLIEMLENDPMRMYIEIP